MPEFVHLHNHSDYSLLDGAASITKMIAKAKEFEMKHLALTDHGNMFGALRFYKECKENDINPIIGSEFYVAPGSRFVKSGSEKGNKYFHLVLLAKNSQGYKNLIILSSIGYTEGFYYKPRIDMEILRQYASDLICSTACLAGEVPSLILRDDFEAAKAKALEFQELFGKGNFYLELQDHGIPEQATANRGLKRISQETGIPLIATNDMHYVEQTEANAQDIMICIGTNKKKNESKRMSFGGPEFYMKSPEEMASIFHDTPEALSNTVKIAEMCNVEIALPGPILPDYKIPKEFEDPVSYLRHLTYEGLKDRYPNVTEEIRQRADYELNIIISMEFTGYFLIVWDFIDYARNNGIPVGPGRGSGAGSIVAYALKITDIDPLKYNLLFERFLNPERVSMPDFDIDFCFIRRSEVIDYVTRKYGAEKVGQIITFGTLKPKAVIKDVARVLDIPFAESNIITKLIPDGPKVKLKDAVSDEPKLKEYYEKGGVYKELIETGLILEGLNRHTSTHAAGVVIGRKALTEYVPLYRDSKTGAVSTQYTMDQLEECGLVKMDFLGLKTLTLITNTEKLIRSREDAFSAEEVPEDDENTFVMLGEGKSTCVFQFESSGMQGILKRAKPKTIEELIALNALYRPGPMQFIDQYIDSKMGRQKIVYPLPELQPVLEETYGVIVYQEQVMEIARIVAGYTLGGAEILRRAMGKKKAEAMAKEKVKFLKGAQEKGYTQKQAEDIFELLIPFAGYGFNKSHAAAYSVLAYKTAYLKANYPAEFMAANLTNEIASTDKLSEYIDESRKMGLEILPPSVNLSEQDFSVSEGKIIYGLIGIKGVGQSAVDEILKIRKQDGSFTDFMEFLERVDLRAVNRKVIETGIMCGLFDDFGCNRATLFYNLDHALEWAVKQKENKAFGQTSLFDGADEETALPSFEMETVEEWPKDDILKNEKEILGFYCSGHPMDSYKDIWEKAANLDLADLDKGMEEKSYTLCAILKNTRVIATRTGKPMAFGLVEDFRGSAEIVVFPNTYEKYRHFLETNKVLGIKGKLDKKRGDPKVLVDEIIEPEELTETKPRAVHIRIKLNGEAEQEMRTLRGLLGDHPGACHVYLHIEQPETGKETLIKAGAQITVNSEDDVIDELKSFSGVSEVWKE